MATKNEIKKITELKLGIMQPYFFPYLGYWQLINAVDKFIILDDVAFIKQGFIHKNYILAQGKPQTINLQINAVSSNKNILEHELSDNTRWKSKLLNSIQLNYSKAPCFSSVMPVLEACITYPERNLSTFLTHQITQIAEFLAIDTTLVPGSSFYEKNLSGQDRIIDICQKENATTYINAIGGQALYSEKSFVTAGLDLKFIKSKPLEYKQTCQEFVPNLSIIDVLMFNDLEIIQQFLNEYTLL